MLEITLKYNTAGLNQSDMLMEVIASRGIIREDKTLEEWSKYFYSIGNVKAYILAGDTDRWHKFIYAAEVLRKNPNSRDVGIGELSHVRNKEFDELKEQPELDGRQWGGVDTDPVREQIEGKAAKLIADTRGQAVPAEVELSAVAKRDAFLSKWVQAEKLAHAPRESWEGKCDFEFEQMIKYCYAHLRDIGEVPQPFPDNMLDLFWQRPTPGSLPMDEKAVARRNYITTRVILFWQKSLGKDGNKTKMNIDSPSYRVVLAAQELSKRIERYASNDDKDKDEKLANMVKAAALDYFNAYFPINGEGSRPGPIDTLDPDYVGYIRLCRKYNLQIGTLLHEAKL